jgi:hypothetical protein
MELTLIRQIFTSKSTVGELHIDGKFECYTLEDRDRGLYSTMDPIVREKTKVFGSTAIPYGKYEVVITFSNHFQQLMPLLVSVPGWEGVRIHSGNKAEDTEGCILVGKTKSVDFIGSSRDEYAPLFAKLQDACSKGKVFLEIIHV